MKKLRIGIQGVQASFHDVAARNYFFHQEIEQIECPTFRYLCDTLHNSKADLCMMAIENSIAGSILPNYSLLENYHFKIVGEIYERIEMALMALPDQNVEDLQYVQSHPMAIFQCEEFLNHYPHLKILEASDTAESAKVIKQKNLNGYGAIASALAAETYGLHILKTGIETNKQNYTRFLVISRGDTPVETQKHPSLPNKTTLRFQTSHLPGSLVQILDIFGKNNLNMTKIQSVPILGSPYKYSFHVDLEWEELAHYQKAFNELKSKALNLIHFGDYLRAEKPTA